MADSDWQECLEWIKRLDFLDRDEPLLRANVQIHDFAQNLRDGVVLCRILNALARGIIDQRQFSQRPHMSQVYMISLLELIFNYYIMDSSDEPHYYTTILLEYIVFIFPKKSLIQLE